MESKTSLGRFKPATLNTWRRDRRDTLGKTGSGTKPCSTALPATTGRVASHTHLPSPMLSPSTSISMVVGASSTSVAGLALSLCYSPISSRTSLDSTQIPECWLRPNELPRRSESSTPAGSSCGLRTSPDPSVPSGSSASVNRSTGWTEPGLRRLSARCSMPMAPSSKSTFGTPARRTRCPRAGHTHQSPRPPLMSCVAAGSVPTAVPVKGSGTPRPMGRTQYSRPPGSLPKNS